MDCKKNSSYANLLEKVKEEEKKETNFFFSVKQDDFDKATGEIKNEFCFLADTCDFIQCEDTVILSVQFDDFKSR